MLGSHISPCRFLMTDIACWCGTDEEEDVDLMEQPMKWVLPPNVSAASNASEEPALRSRRKQDSTYQESTKPRAPPVARRPSNVSSCHHLSEAYVGVLLLQLCICMSPCCGKQTEQDSSISYHGSMMQQ